MTLFDRRALPAVFVGIGMALTIGVSFLLVIPIQPVYWLLAIPAGLLIGYYANGRAARGRGEWLPILGNGLVAGIATGVTMAALLLGVRALFFNLDNGYRDPDAGGPFSCTTGADCVYQRYLADGRADQLRANGVIDVETFTTFYWQQQLQTAGLLVVLVVVGSLGGGALYWVFRPKTPAAGALPRAEGQGTA